VIDLFFTGGFWSVFDLQFLCETKNFHRKNSVHNQLAALMEIPQQSFTNLLLTLRMPSQTAIQ